MHKFSDLAKRIMQRSKRAAAASERAGTQPQELRIIPGMPAAPEPCLLPAKHWSEDLHPKNAVAQPKIDGIRALCLQTTIITRGAQPLDAALQCLPALVDLENRFGEPMVFDGEYQEEDGFDATLTAMKRGVGEGIFWLFDAVPYREWAANRFTMPLQQRMDRIADLFDHDHPFTAFLPAVPAPTPADACALADNAWARGTEGLVVKDANSLYHRGRSQAWLKLKRNITLDGLVTDVVVPDGDLARAVALVRLLGKTHKVAAIPHDIRQMIWRDINQRTDGLTGRMVECSYNDRTETGAFRGLKIDRLRPDKD